jgi:putative membrane protein
VTEPRDPGPTEEAPKWPPPQWPPPQVPPGTTAAPGVEAVPWRRLDPRMLLVHPVLELVKFLPFLLGVLLLGRNSGNGWWQLFGVGIPVVLGVLRFLTTRFRITPTQVELQRGLIGKKVLSARLDRVRAVELTSSPIHRILGLAKVEIGTASGAKDSDDKFVLDGLPLAEARQMRVALLHRLDTEASSQRSSDPASDPASDRASTTQTPAIGDTDDVPLLQFDPRWVRYAPLTSSGNVIAAGVLAILGQFSESLGDRVFRQSGGLDWFTDRPLGTVIPVLVIGGLVLFVLLGAAFSVLGYLISNWGFTLSRDARGRSFHVHRGLLTTTETSLERERVRGLEVIEPLGLRLVGAARLAAIVTGVSSHEASSAQLVPPAPREVIVATGAQVIESPEPLLLPLTQHGPAARRRRYTRALTGAAMLPLAAVALAWTTPLDWWVVLPTLLAFAVALLLATDRYRRLGHGLTEEYLLVRSGSLRGRRDVLQRSGIIGWNVQQSWFQRRAGLATLVATTAAGQQAYAAIDIPESQAIALAEAAVPGLVTPFLS